MTSRRKPAAPKAAPKRRLRTIGYRHAYDIMMHATAAQKDKDAEDRMRVRRWKSEHWMEPDWERFRHTVWSLQHIPLSEIRVDRQYHIDAARVDAYAKMPASKFPPVLMGDDGTPLDGQHRVLAARQRGSKTILAYQPYTLTPTEARALAAQAVEFKKERGRLPSLNSKDAQERSLAEGASAFMRYKQEGRYMRSRR